MMTLKTIRLAAWLALAAIIFVTVSPIGIRPHDLLPVDADRALAFAVMAALFVLAYPRHFLLAAILLIASAGMIEMLQIIAPTRHPHVADAAVKTCGAAIGLVVGWSIRKVLAHRLG